MSSQDPVTPVPEAKPEDENKKKRKVLPVFLSILSVLLVAGGITFGAMSLWPGHTPAGATALIDMQGNVVVPDEPAATSSAFMEQAQMVTDDGGEGFVVPSLNLDVPLGSINEVEGVMNPPNFTSAFVIRNRGASLDNADQGTVYIVTHAIYQGHAPGNYLQADGQVSLKPGDIIKADGKEYSFVEAQIIAKEGQGGLADHAELWTDDPGRLIIVTCVVRPEGGIAVNNLVIIAQLVA
ncbi:MAG: hypothetical protein LBV00_04605 [Propionibacteriaceae bacterium]|jgi:hypothetical protein|nr:hypothetical protein [Propionibacteriaceae bacterium]